MKLNYIGVLWINFLRKLGDNRTGMVGAEGGRCMSAARRPKKCQGEPIKTERACQMTVTTGFQDQRCRKQALSAWQEGTGS